MNKKSINPSTKFTFSIRIKNSQAFSFQFQLTYFRLFVGNANNQYNPNDNELDIICLQTWNAHAKFHKQQQENMRAVTICFEI